MKRVQNSPIVKTELIELVIPANSQVTRFYLPDVQNIRNVHLIGLEIDPDVRDQQTVTRYQQELSSLNNIPLIDVTNLNRGFLTLQLYNGKNAVQNLPLRKITPNWYLGRNYRDFSGQKINWPKSYVEFNRPLAPAADQVLQFVIYYKDALTEEQKDKRANFRNRS